MNGSPKILVADDDKLILDLYRAEFTNVGFEVSTAKDGEEALKEISDFKPDVVLLDIMMPSVHGFQVLEVIRNTPATKKTKVVIFTALGESDTKARAQEYGADGYLVKSQITMGEVVKYIQKILEAKE